MLDRVLDVARVAVAALTPSLQPWCGPYSENVAAGLILGAAALLLFALSRLLGFGRGKAASACPFLRAEDDPDTVVIYGFLPVPGSKDVPLDFSPFVAKVRAYCAMRGIPTKYVAMNRHRGKISAPLGKLPCVHFRNQLYPDSTLILAMLDQDQALAKKYPRLSSSSSAEKKAQDRVLVRMMEEAFYFTGMVYLRWLTDIGFSAMQRAAFGGNFLLKHVISKIVRSQVRKSLFAQGTARHSYENNVAFAKADVDAFSQILGERMYFGSEDGSSPGNIDATSSIVADMHMMEGCPLREHLKTKRNLMSYAERMNNKLRF